MRQPDILVALGPADALPVKLGEHGSRTSTIEAVIVVQDPKRHLSFSLNSLAQYDGTAPWNCVVLNDVFPSTSHSVTIWHPRFTFAPLLRRHMTDLTPSQPDEFSPEIASAESPVFSSEPPKPTLHRLFFGDDGLRAGWSFALFAAIF